MAHDILSIEELLAFVRKSDAELYHDWPKDAPLESLPEISREDFLRIPLSRRRYKDEKSLVKIVRAGERAFLSEWAFDDIAQEEFGEHGMRPLVYMSDPHEAIEKSMWCYEQGVVPLIGEMDPDLAAYAAGKYQVDALITDPNALQKLRPYLQKLAAPLECITVISDSFDAGKLAEYKAFAKTFILVLALPETGSIARAEYSASPRFTPVKNCIIEKVASGMLVTKLVELVTPIVKYRTELGREWFV